MVNHGQPHVLVACGSGAFILVIGAFFTALAVLNMGWRWQPALGRVALVLSFGSVVFMLPHAVSLPATGEFWWATVLERYAVYCIPYPFTGWLIVPRGHLWIPAVSCIAVATCLTLVWLSLLNHMREQTATALRHELGVPDSMLYAIGTLGAQTTDGYFYDGSALSLTYRIKGYSDPNSTSTYSITVNGKVETVTSHDYLGWDLVLAVFPAKDATPCLDIVSALENAVGGGTRSEATCGRESSGRWQYTDGLSGDMTQIEIADGYFIALTVNSQASGLTAQFAPLFASLRHPTDAQLVSIGLSDAQLSPLA
jgi:hypothetical protein